jgi:hypothetical protein
VKFKNKADIKIKESIIKVPENRSELLPIFKMD